MTAFATCAYPGCYIKIPYDPKTDTERPRYCECHMRNNPRDLYIAVIPKPLSETSSVIPKTTLANVILICPKCKIRKEVSYEDFCKSVGELVINRICCTNRRCNGTPMIYHKDVDNPEYMGFLQEYVR